MSVESLPADVRAQYPFAGQKLTVASGHAMNVVDVGQGETLLFVHGNPTWSFYWRHLINGLKDSYRCVAVDHIGCGMSDKPQEWSYRLEDHVKNLVSVVDALDLRDVTLVVHDWGGPIGFGAAMERADRIKRVVIFNTGVFEGPIPLEIRMCRWPGIGALTVRGLNGFVRAGLLRATADRSRFKNGVGKGYLAPYGNWADRIAIHKFVLDIPLEADHPTRKYFLDLGERIRTLADRPTLILWGEQDFCFTTFYRDGFRQRFPNAEVHSWPDVAHWIAEDAHERIVPLMKQWLEKHPLPPAPPASR
jgi:pimeloyl-ACP methyl ester carboxylesterase